MKILYAIQGTGNGHISRARDIIPHLQDFCQCDILISGSQCDVELDVPVKYRYKGLSFWFGKRGGVDIWNTLRHADLFRLNREINEVDVEAYDLVINDFEPVSAWACIRKKVPCVSLSHQGSLLSSKVPKPLFSDFLGSFILKNYAPAKVHFGFHFNSYDENIYTPVIRQQVRESKVEVLPHYSVYLPAYDDQHLVKILSQFPHIEWHVFSKHTKLSYATKNCKIYKITNDEFVADMAKSTGVLCGAGFETPAEALFLKKKLMVVPMKGQYEQQYNAAALDAMGVPVLQDLNLQQKEKIGQWLLSSERIEVNYPDITRIIVRKIMELNVQKVMQENFLDYYYKFKMRTQNI